MKERNPIRMQRRKGLEGDTDFLSRRLWCVLDLSRAMSWQRKTSGGRSDFPNKAFTNSHATP